MSTATKLKELVAAAKAERIELPQLAPMLIAAWNDPVIADYGPSGMTHPDENGFVRFRELDEARASYMEDGQAEAAKALRYSYACFPGAQACEPGSLAQYSAANNTSQATFFRGMGYEPWDLVYHTKTLHDAFGNPYFRLDMSSTFPDVYPLPFEEKGTGKPINRTVDECVAYMLAQAKQWVK